MTMTPNASVQKTARAEQAVPVAARVVNWLSQYAAFSAVVITLALALILAPAFFSGSNVRTVLIQTSILGIVVLGQAVALIGKGMDMSVAAVMTFAAVFVSQGSSSGNIPLLILQLALLIVSVALVNGLLVTWRGVPPFVATFATLIVVDGARLAYSRGQSAGSASDWLRSVGGGELFGIPNTVVIWVVLGIVVYIALNRSSWGRWLYATGTNREAANHAGVPTQLVTMSTYLITATFAVLAGVLLSGYLGYVDNTLGSNYNLNSMAAAIIGGVAFTGGRGGIIGAATGALLLTILVNLLVVLGLSIFWQLVVQGAVLVIAVIIQGLRAKYEAKT